jgi:transketolase
MASYAGLSDFKDGATHFSVIDLAVIRAMPNLTVMVAADAVEVSKMVPLVGEHTGPVYLRISRAAVPAIFDDSHVVEIGKGVTLRDGGDVTLVCTGLMVARSLEAAEQLAAEGIDARVLEIHTLKPLDNDLLCQAARETGAIVTAEEHSVIGGLGGGVAEALSACCPVPVIRVGVQDAFCVTALDVESLLDYEGMAVEDVLNAARHALRLKGKG